MAKRVKTSRHKITVTNQSGTGNKKCRCGTWIDHWEQYADDDASVCSEVACKESNELVGAHVRTTKGKPVRIVPLCNSHNGSHNKIELKERTRRVLANIRKCAY